jgi:hypothetical protein
MTWYWVSELTATAPVSVRGKLMSQSPVLGSNERLERLEQETQHLAARLKQASVQISILQLALLLGMTALVGGGYYLITTGRLRIEGISPGVAQRVETRDFGFYNRFGTRVMFEADNKFGQPQIVFLDANKRLRMRLMVFPDGDGTGGVVVYDSRSWRGVLRMDGADNAVLNLVGKDLKGGISMMVTPDGTPSLKMTDKTGKVLFEVPKASP